MADDLTITVDEARALLRGIRALSQEAELPLLEDETAACEKLSRFVDNADFEKGQVLPEPPPTRFGEDEYEPNIPT